MICKVQVFALSFSQQYTAVEIAYGHRQQLPLPAKFLNRLARTAKLRAVHVVDHHMVVALASKTLRLWGRSISPEKPNSRSSRALLYHFDPSVGTEELGHLEMIGAIVHQLTRDLSMEQIKKAGFDAYFVDHTTGVYPTAASGFPWSAASMAVKGDVITDLTENMAAEQKARTTYDNILRLSDDPDVNDVIRFLREREVVHYQRFGEGLRRAIEKMDQKNFYAVNPAFDRT